MKYLLISVFLLATCGCTSINKEVGDYIRDSVTASVERKIDERLAARGLSAAEIKAAIDLNKDGKVASTEVVSVVKELAKDYASAEAKKLVDDKLASLQSSMVRPDQLESKTDSMKNWLLVTVLGLISSYLGKQIVSAKSDSERDKRLALLEKALGRDLDGDGDIGNSSPPKA